MKKSTFFTSSPHFCVISATTGINGKRCIPDSRGMGLTVVHLYYILYGDGGDEGRYAAYQSDTGRIESALQRLVCSIPMEKFINE